MKLILGQNLQKNKLKFIFKKMIDNEKYGGNVTTSKVTIKFIQACKIQKHYHKEFLKCLI